MDMGQYIFRVPRSSFRVRLSLVVCGIVQKDAA